MARTNEATIKLDRAGEKNDEAIGRAILKKDADLSALLLEIGELIDGAVDDLNTEDEA